MPATFELFRDASEEFRWRLRHDNGQIIAAPGQGYSSKSNAINGIESVKTNSPEAPVEDQTGDGEPQISGSGGTSKATFEVYLDSADEFRWRLRHDNGDIIADPGEGYSSKQNAIGGLDSVRANAPEAPIEDQTVADRPATQDEPGSQPAEMVVPEAATETGLLARLWAAILRVIR